MAHKDHNSGPDLAGRVIGPAMKVHRGLGRGCMEGVYAGAPATALEASGIAARRDAPLPVCGRGQAVGDFRCDFLVDEALVAETKSVAALGRLRSVFRRALTATGVDDGLLLNFGGHGLDWKRKLRVLGASRSVHPAKSPAFTLLELLVAMAVLAILVVMLMGLVTSASSLWQASENRADAYREARAAMSIITRDLGGAVAAANTSYFLPNGAAAASLQGGSIVLSTNAPFRHGALLFLSALPSSAQLPGSRSDVCQVGYFLAYDRTALSTNLPGGQPSLNLYRYFLSSDGTFLTLTNAASPFRAGIVPTDPDVDLLARNIREFRVTPLMLTTNNLFTTNFTPTTNRPLPDALEVSITAVNQEAARRFAGRDDWTALNPPTALTNQQQTFTTRIRIPAGGVP